MKENLRHGCKWTKREDRILINSTKDAISRFTLRTGRSRTAVINRLILLDRWQNAKDHSMRALNALQNDKEKTIV
jgi:hypothetical protein